MIIEFRLLLHKFPIRNLTIKFAPRDQTSLYASQSGIYIFKLVFSLELENRRKLFGIEIVA